MIQSKTEFEKWWFVVADAYYDGCAIRDIAEDAWNAALEAAAKVVLDNLSEGYGVDEKIRKLKEPT